jgi:hypothetical protein
MPHPRRNFLPAGKIRSLRLKIAPIRETIIPINILFRIWRSRPAAEFWALLGSGSGILLHFRDIA